MTVMPFRVASSFSVRLTRPAEGIPIVLSGRSGDVARSITNSAGVASFRGVKFGDYGARVEYHPDDWVPIRVSQWVLGKRSVALSFPSWRPFPVAKSLKGTLRSGNVFGNLIEPPMRFELLDALTGKTVGSAATQEAAFDLHDSAPGIYFLNLRDDRMRTEGQVAVEVRPDAPSDDVDLEFSWTSCGLTFVDLARCRRPELRFLDIEGTMLDERGRPLTLGEVRLEDAKRRLVERAEIPNDGVIPRLSPPAGHYNLIAKAAASRMLDQPIEIDPTAGPASLQVTLRYDQCGEARLRPN